MTSLPPFTFFLLLSLQLSPLRIQPFTVPQSQIALSENYNCITLMTLDTTRVFLKFVVAPVLAMTNRR